MVVSALKIGCADHLDGMNEERIKDDGGKMKPSLNGLIFVISFIFLNEECSTLLMCNVM